MYQIHTSEQLELEARRGGPHQWKMMVGTLGF